MQLIQKLLYGTVFFTGAAVLVMEVAAVRLLAPYFGSSLYVLSSVLTIILLALSLGYYLGGKTSDRLPYATPLYMIITTAGVSLLVLLSLASVALPIAGPYMPITSGPLIFSALFFFFPAFLLGIDSPYVIKLLTQSLPPSESGGVVGATFFWSTAGSITGSLAAGFWLIPHYGLMNTLLGTSIVIIVVGIGIGLLVRTLWSKQPDYDLRNNRPVGTPIIVALTIAVFSLFFITSQPVAAGTIYETDGYYSKIRIYEDEIRGLKVRILKRDTNHSSALNLDNDEIVFPYAQFAPLYSYLLPDAESFLMLGGGAYTIPRSVHARDEDIQIDIVELEPKLIDIAHEYFDLPYSDRIRNHVIDARVFANQEQGEYDVIFIDTFNSGHYIPPHLVTTEFFTRLGTLLSDDGVLIINLIVPTVQTEERTLLGSMLRTITTTFPNLKMYKTILEISDTNSQNIMLVARPDQLPIELPDDLIIDSYYESYELSELELNPEDYISPNDTIFTDNHSPVELLILKNQLLIRL